MNNIRTLIKIISVIVGMFLFGFLINNTVSAQSCFRYLTCPDNVGYNGLCSYNPCQFPADVCSSWNCPDRFGYFASQCPLVSTWPATNCGTAANPDYICSGTCPSTQNPDDPWLPGDPPPDPVCTPTYPVKAEFVSPDGWVTIGSNEVLLDWANNGNWGEGCPTTRRNKVFIQENCEGVMEQIGDNTRRGSQFVNKLKWGTLYCWRVKKGNGSLAAFTWRRRFYTPSTPSITSSGFDASSISKCSLSSTSGRYTTDPTKPATNNPITYTVDFSYDSGVDLFRELRLVMLHDSEPMSTNMRIAEIDPYVDNYPAFKVTNLFTNPVYTHVTNNSGGGSSSGNLTNPAGTATLMGLNTGSTTVTRLNNYTVRVTWTVRLEDTLRSGGYRVLVSGIALTPDGNSLISIDAGVNLNNGSTLKYRQTDSWAVDMQAPNVNVTDPVAISNNRMQVTWSASDSTGEYVTGLSEVRSYCYLDSGSATITDIAYGDINVDSTALDYNSPSNCLVTRNSLGTRTYQVPGTLQSNLGFRAVAIDGACNSSKALSSVLVSAEPWMITKDASVSANSGITGFKPLNTNLGVGYPGMDSEDDFVSEYAIYSGNGALPTSRLSKYNLLSFPYQDKSTKPPSVSNASNWYDAIFEVVEKKITIQNFTGTLSGSINTSLSSNGIVGLNDVVAVSITTSGGVGNYVINGSASNVICDVNAIIFIRGNLYVRPNFIKSSNATGCLFVVSGNIVIEPGVQSTPNGATRSSYDRVEAFMLADGEFTVNSDTTNLLTPDGLYINGGVVANRITMNRDLGFVNNALLPSEVIDYDPYYLYKFRDIINFTKFSIRQE